jgi:hypothetical protein
VRGAWPRLGGARSDDVLHTLRMQTPCNPGFTLEESFRLSKHIAFLPQLLMDTANLPYISSYDAFRRITLLC